MGGRLPGYGRKVPNGFLALGWLLFLQEKIKGIIIRMGGRWVGNPVAGVLLALCVSAFVLASDGRPSLLISEH
jgi:hypothetical protein